ncbi:phage tail assembly protein T [Advenella mimigardefordensis]|uniref:phage tail assembly protein T n=1 Tax=Advenella mimigardefordensis TaxID=302406 RepID=UPI00046D54F5|nr:hypothetical protein [Advenella mimigardefordensis]
MNGIGGRTIAECREKLSYQEFLLWCAYIDKHGSLNIGDRIEHSSAIVAAVNANIHSKKKHKITDFMPHFEAPDDKQVLSPEGLAGRLAAVSVPKNEMRLRKDK